jgi:alkanesulfonate monooxygenase SsuD/methylene tetrahydromethanopterin reductase-like flavin-dependent oxidoreductase (luciferase family)
VRFGFVLPGSDPRTLVELAVAADEAGWDGVFVWEAAYGHDAWSVLAAAAVQTKRIRLGTMLTPLPWRRPWKVASQVATLDQLSDGRAILAVGLGAVDATFGGPPDVEDRKHRAALLDEGIDLIDRLWSGALSYEGTHFRFDVHGGPIGSFEPVQQPRPPIWVVGAWPRPTSMARVLRCDGILPNVLDPTSRPAQPEDITAMTAWLRERGGMRPGFDVVTEGETPADPAAAARIVRPWADAGCTWWLETRWQAASGTDTGTAVRERIAGGPPSWTG